MNIPNLNPNSHTVPIVGSQREVANNVYMNVYLGLIPIVAAQVLGANATKESYDIQPEVAAPAAIVDLAQAIAIEAVNRIGINVRPVQGKGAGGV